MVSLYSSQGDGREINPASAGPSPRDCPAAGIRIGPRNADGGTPLENKGFGASGRDVAGLIARVGDGIRTRDIQIHNLVPGPGKDNHAKELRIAAGDVATHLPPDNRPIPDDLRSVIDHWGQLSPEVRGAIALLVRSAVAPTDHPHNPRKRRNARRGGEGNP